MYFHIGIEFLNRYILTSAGNEGESDEEMN